MLLIENGIIYLTKGDDAVIAVSIENSDGSEYEMQEGDTLTLTVKKSPTDSSVVQLFAQSNDKNIALRHSETSKIKPGRYSCDIQLTTNDGYRFTIYPVLPLAKRPIMLNYDNFIVMPEVTTI